VAYKEYTGEVLPLDAEQPVEESEKEKKFQPYSGKVLPLGTKVKPREVTLYDGEVLPLPKEPEEPTAKDNTQYEVTGRDQVVQRKPQGSFGEELVKGIVGSGKQLIEGAPKVFGMEFGSRRAASAMKDLDQFARIDKGELKKITDETAPVADFERYLRADPEQRQQMRQAATARVSEGITNVAQAQQLYQQFQKDNAKYQGRVPDLTDVQTVNDFSKWLGYNMGAGAVQLAPVILAALTTGGAGAFATGTGLAYQETLGNRLQFLEKQFKGRSDEETANNISDYLRKTGNVNAMVALASGALDMAGPVGTILRKQFAKEFGKDVVKYATKREAAIAGVKQVPREIAEEAATGAAQEATQILGKRAVGEQTGDLLTKENIKDVINAAAAEGVGGALGSGINVATEVGKQVAQQKAEEAQSRELAKLERAQRIEARMGQLGPVYNQLVDSFRNEGLSEIEAIRRAGELISQTGFDRELLGTESEGLGAGAEPAVGVEGEGVTGQPTAPAGAGLDGTSEVAGGPRAGEGAQPTALTQEEAEAQFAELEQDAHDNYPPDIARRITDMAAEAVLDGANPQFAFNQAINAVTEEVEAVAPARVEPTLTEEPTAIPTPEGARVEPTLAEEPAAIEQAAPEAVQPTEVVTPEEPAPAEAVAEPTTAEPTEVVSEPKDLEEPTPAPVAPETNPATGMQRKGKSTGRKRIVRTPEEQAAHDEVRRSTQGYLRDGQRAAQRALDAVNEPFDPSQYGTEEEAKAAAEVHESQMLKALTDAYRIANDPALRRNKAGQLAKQTIENPNLTPRQKTIAENRAKREASISRSLPLLEGTNDAHETMFGLFNTGSEAMAYIQATGNSFESLLARRLKPFLRDVRIVVVTDPERQLPRDQRIRDEFNGARGLYVEYGGTKTIYLNKSENGLTNTIVLHEAVHGAVNAKLDQWLANPASVDAATKQAFEDLMSVMAQTAKFYDILSASGQADQILHELDRVGAFSDIKEFIAYGLTQPEMQNFLMSVPEVQVPRIRNRLNLGAFGNFVNAVRNMFNIKPDKQSAFTDLIAVTDTILSQDLTTPTDADRARTSAAKRLTSIDKLKQKLIQSNKATEVNDSVGAMFVKTRNFKDALKLLQATYSAMNVGKLRLLLPTLSTEDITRWIGDDIRNIRNVNKAVQDLGVMRTRMVRKLAEQVPEWVDFARNNEKGGRLLGDTMHASTLREVNPTLFPDVATALQNDATLQRLNNELQDPNTPAKSKPSIKGKITKRKQSLEFVYKLWNELGGMANGKGREIYKMALDQYRKTFETHEQLLLDKIASSNIPGDINDASTPKGRLMASITETFQKAKQLGVYFPLMRYGNYWLRVGPSNSRNSEFYMFESAIARNKFLEDRVEELQQAGDKRTRDEMIEGMDIDMGDTLDGMRGQIVDSSQMLKSIFGLLDQNPLSDIEAVKDQIYQMFLMTLPDKDIRKRFTHRQGKTGFSADVIRNFIVAQHTAANQLSRLAYNDKIRNAIGAAYAELAGNPDKLKLNVFVDEIAQRAVSEMEPKISKPGSINWDAFASAGNQIVFYYLLTAPKSALVQMTQLPVVGLPTLFAEFSADRVTAVTARYSNLFNMMGLSKTDAQGNVVTEWGAPSVNDSSYIRNHKDRRYASILKKAWAYANDRGIFMETYAGDITSRSRVPTAAYHGPLRRGARATLNFMSGAFHHAERITREIMYMSTFELAFEDAKNSGLSDQEAFRKASERALKITYDSLFNYTQYNKPRVMKNPLGKVAFQFMTFPLQMASYLARNFYGMLPLLNKQDKRDAAIKFFGTLGMTGLFAGAVGMPMYSMVMGFLEGIRDLMRPDDDEDYDEDDEGNPLGKRSLDLWFREWFLPHYFGPDSSIAKAMGFTDEQAKTLTRAVEMGPVSAFTDINIGSSVSLDGLFFRNDLPSGDAKSQLAEMAMSFFGGALSSSISQIWSGFEDFNNGDVNKAIEKWSPAFTRGVVRAATLQDKGLRASDGSQILDPEFYTTGKLLAQSIGFASTEAAQIQKHNILAKRIMQDIEQERTHLDTRLRKAADNYFDTLNKKDEKRLDEVLADIEKYNYRNGMFAIDGTHISEVISNSQKRQGQSYQGLYVPQRAQQFIYPLVEKSRTGEYK
jgi:hypothetical protein